MLHKSDFGVFWFLVSPLAVQQQDGKICSMVSAGTLQDLLSRQMQSSGGKLYSDLDVCRQALGSALISAIFSLLQHGNPRTKPASSFHAVVCNIHSSHHFSTTSNAD